MILLVSLSRIYLGVHWPVDILGGLSIGIVLLAAYTLVARVNLEAIPLGRWIVGSALGAVLLYLLQPVGDGPMTVGFLLGASIGYQLELRYVDFTEHATLGQNIVKLVLGLLVLFLLRIVLKPLVGWMPGELSYVVRYGAIGLWATFGAPLAFTKLGLHKKPPAARTV